MAESPPVMAPAALEPVAQGSARPARKEKGGSRERFSFIDRFRGLVGIMMALGHSSGFFNSAWKSLDMFDPLFRDHGQFFLRYMGYLCAPGFLMMNGAVSWFSYTRRRAAGTSPWRAKWHLIQRGLFLVLVQVTWVNASWLGFRRFNLPHLGIIACIGISMCLLALFIGARWWVRLGVAAVVLVAHPLLLTISYDPAVLWQRLVMQTFVDAGDWNKYPVLPWFALGTLGSVMAAGWFSGWKTPRRRIAWSLGIGLSAIAAATAVRLLRGFGNTTPFDTILSYSFFLDQKYPPNLFHNLWFFGAVSFTVGVVHLVGEVAPVLVRWLATIGKVPLFFYCIHIAILSVVADRFGLYYRQGGVAASLIGWIPLLIVTYPIARWFGRVKERSSNPIIKLI